MNICVSGCRHFNQKAFIIEHLDILLAGREFTLISGNAKGVDRIAEKYAKEHMIEVKPFIPDWDTYRKSAGMKRNVEMAKVSDMLIAFWDRESNGTGHMIRTMNEMKKPVFIVDITLI